MVSAARRRMSTLLKSAFGPKYNRLTKAQQREVAELVEANRGREARKRITTLDEERRAKRTTRDTVRRALVREARDFASLPEEDRKRFRPFYGENKSAAFWRLYDQANKA